MSEDFTIGKDSFLDLRIDAGKSSDNFYYFYHERDRRLVKQFVLDDRTRVRYICRVTLIKKNERFTPRLVLLVEQKGRTTPSDTKSPKAIVSLEDCQQTFWELIDFLQSVREVDVPKGGLSFVSSDDEDVVAALRARRPESIVGIIKSVMKAGTVLSERDVNELLQRKQKLQEFKTALDSSWDEPRWQLFFHDNKWIFGYGLNYEIIRHEQGQPNYGGVRLDGRGGQKGDFLGSTAGDIGFTVLVEIKTPYTRLLQGTSEIRSGAWSLSKDLTDAFSQISANIAMWAQDGSTTPENRDRLERDNVFTVLPKGIIVIGRLNQLDKRSKRETFQRFRKTIHGIDILTFDELYERAKFIVHQGAETE